MDILKIFTFLGFVSLLNSCSYVNSYIEGLSFKAKSGPSVVVANSAEIQLIASSSPFGFIPTQIIARPGQVLKLKVTNNLKNMPVIFSILKKDEDPIVNAFLGVQAGESQGWLPPVEHRLVKMKMLSANESESLEITLPSDPGDYAFISSYPGQADELKGLIKIETLSQD